MRMPEGAIRALGNTILRYSCTLMSWWILRWQWSGISHSIYEVQKSGLARFFVVFAQTKFLYAVSRPSPQFTSCKSPG